MSEPSSNRQFSHPPEENICDSEHVYFESVFPVIKREVTRRISGYNLQGDEAEDLAQTTYFNLWVKARQKLKNFTASELRSYVMASAQNAVFDFFRKEKVKRKYFDLNVSEAESVADAAIEVNNEAEAHSIALAYWNQIRKLSLRQNLFSSYQKTEGF